MIASTIDLNEYCKIDEILNRENTNDKNILFRSYNLLNKTQIINEETYNLLKYNRNYLTSDKYKNIGKFRSIIYKTNKNQKKEILAFSPPKCLEFNEFIDKYDINECYAEEFIEGTMINVFYDKDTKKWEISTRSNIGANVKFFDTSPTFFDMFMEACSYNNFNLEILDKNFAYTFILQHPMNRIVMPIAYPALYIIKIYSITDYIINEINLENFYEKELGQNLLKSNIRCPIRYPITSYDAIKQFFASMNTPYYYPGVMLYHKSGERSKLRNPTYEDIKFLRGNQAKLQYQYLYLRKKEKVKDFLFYYPEYKQIFSKYRDLVHQYTNQLYQNYIACYIRKENQKNEIYKRVNNIWIKDDKLSENVFFNNNKFFCESQFNCYNVDQVCVNSKAEEKNIQRKNLKNIISEFDQEYRHDLQIIRKRIDEDYLYNLEIIKQIIFVEKEKKLIYNNLFLELGQEIEEGDIIISPYEKLRDYILGQSNFIKKQNDIIKFSIKYTRKAYDNEDPYWLYCRQTNIKLLPNFLLRLAQTFGNKGDYLKEMDIICAEQGTMSDDGEKWVDKYSGYVIKNIAYDTEEGYTEQGYKLQTREILEKDLGSVILQKEPSLQKKESSVYMDTNAKTILNVVVSLSKYLHINIDKQIDFILKNVLEIQKSSVSSPEEYEKLITKAEKMGKKNIPTYEEAYDTSLLILTFVYLLIAIQTAIPPIRTEKTFPGCIRSFLGYPIPGSIDKSGLIYIACVAHKIKSSIKPWNAIQKIKETNIAKKMELIIETYVLQNKEIMELYKLKTQFLELEENAIIPDSLDIKNWFNFLPPLVRLNINIPSNISTNFKDELKVHIRKGSDKQEEDILILETKCILFSLNIQQNIQKIINKQHPILTNANGDPFLENACCNSTKNSLDYFTTQDKTIIQDNNIVQHISDILYDVGRMASAGVFFDPDNTKFIYPSLGVDFTEETIFKAFIYYCKFNSNLPVSEELRAICLEKPSDFDANDSLESKINKLKSEGKNYNQAAFDQLIYYISKNNIININFNYALVSNVEILRHILSSLEDKETSILPLNFINKFSKLLDTFDVAISSDTDNLRDFKNYLSRQNELMNTQIMDFIKKNSKLNKTKLNNFKFCLSNLTEFSEPNNSLNINKSINFMKESIKNIVKIFPNIVLNKIDYKNIVIPKHWKLSEKHNEDIKNIIKDYYTSLTTLYDDSQLNLIFEKIQSLSRDLILISDNTYYISPIIHQEIEYYSIFDKKLCLLLFNYYFYSILVEYINLIDNHEILRNLDTQLEEEIDLTISASQFQEKELEDMGGMEEVSEIDIVTGEKKELGMKIASVIINFVNIICKSKETIDLDYSLIMSKVMRSKEKEKTVITDFLKELTDEEREIENIFKNNKLGQWNKGLQKGLTQYVKETYDDEREQIEKQALLDAKLGLDKSVTGMNKDIYKLDMEEQEAQDQEIDQEEYDLGFLGEDDDYGDGDGDEGY